MNRRSPDRLAAGLLTLLLWALVAASVLYWYFRVSGVTPMATPPAAGAGGSSAEVDTRQVARALGALAPAAPAADAAPAPALAGRLVLRGIVTHGGRGAALIGVDGKPPKPVRVGAALDGVEGGWTLRSVTPHAVVLGAGDEQLRLEMPPLAERSSAGDAVAPTRPPAAAANPPPRPAAAPALPVPGRTGAGGIPLPQAFSPQQSTNGGD